MKGDEGIEAGEVESYKSLFSNAWECKLACRKDLARNLEEG